jgi:hypothetical protein
LTIVLTRLSCAHGSGDSYDVLISYAHSDGIAARELNGSLNECGLDHSAFCPGLRWLLALEDPIGRFGAVAILVFENGIGKTQLRVRAAKIAVQPPP